MNPEELRRRVAALKRAGASQADIDAFVAESEQAATPATAMPPARDPDEDAAYGRAERYAKNYGMTDNLLRTATFGFGDEIRSAVGAAKDVVTGKGPYGASYRGRMRAEQEGMDRFAKDHPKQAIGSAVVGGLTTAVGSAPATVSRTVAQAVRGAAASGAAYGAASGAGEARGGLRERLAGAGKGAAIGATAGAVLQGAASRIGSFFKRTTPTERADDLILDRLAQGSTSLDDAERSAAAARAAGKPVTMLDVGGPSMPRLGRDATAFPTKGGDRLVDFVEGRMTDQPGRVVGDLATTGKLTRVSSSREAIETLAQERAQLAGPMYDAIRDVPVVDSRLAQLIDLPDFQRAYETARRVAARKAATGQGQPLPPLDRSRPLTVGTLDQIKRAMDDVAYVAKRSPLDAGGMGPTETASLKQVIRQVLAIGDDATRNPQTGQSAYAAARAVYEGPTRLMEALDEAASSFLSPKVSAVDVKATLAKMGPAEREAYKAGALDHIASKLDNAKTGRDVSGLLDSPATAKKLQQLFDDPADYLAWRDRFLMERGFGATRNTVAVGSRTTPMAAGAAEIGANTDALTATVQSVLSLSPAPLIRQGVARRVGARMQGISQQNADAVAQRLRLGADDPDELVQLIQQLRAREAMPRGGTPVRRAVRGIAQVLPGLRF